MVFCLFALSPCHAEGKKKKLTLTEQEFRALRREMVEMDLNLRNLVSAMSMNFALETAGKFEQLESFQITQMPNYKDAAISLINKIKINNLINYFSDIHKEAEKARKMAKKTHRNKTSANWKIIHESFSRIIESCRGCHDQLEVEWK